MLSIAPMAVTSADYYLSLGSGSYYLSGGEPEGKWIGRGPSILGLSDTVNEANLKSLFLGYSTKGTKLVQNAGATTGKNKRKPGWDMTFSVPKSLSVLWSQADENTRKAIQDAGRMAVQDTVYYLEANFAFSRTGKFGSGEDLHTRLLAAVFEHGTSRAFDPQLHFHALVLNIGIDDEGKTRSLVSKPFYENKMLLGAYFRLSLANHLEKDLGLSFYRPEKRGSKANYFEVKGVPKDICDHFSKRRKEVEKELKKIGVESASASAYAALKTRKVKDLVPPRSELLDNWKTEGKRFEFEPSKVLGTFVKCSVDKRLKQSIEKSIDEITAYQSHFSEKEILTATLVSASESPVSPSDTINRVKEDLKVNSDIVTLGQRNEIARYTTKEVLAIEKELLRDAESLSTRKFTRAPEMVIKKATEKNRTGRLARVKTPIGKHFEKLFSSNKGTFKLDVEQAEAVRYITSSSGRIKCISGVAGAGKTTLLQAAREVFEDSGYTVLGTSLSGKAAKVLENETGIKSDTIRMREIQTTQDITSLAKHHAKQLLRAALGLSTAKPPKLLIDKKTVLVVDEAGMVGTRDMALLVKAVKKGGGKLVLVGDTKQLPSIQAGGAFGSLCSRFGSRHLKTNRRQKNSWERENAEAIRRGDAETALAKWATKGRLFVGASMEDSSRKLLSDWKKFGGVKEPGKHVVIATTNALVNQYNKLAQKERIKAGLVKNENILVAGERLHVGDRVMMRTRIKDANVKTGETGQLVGIGGILKKHLVIKIDGEKQLRTFSVKDLEKLAVEQKSERPISLGYAGTIHRFQGETFEHAYFDPSGNMADKEIAYVATTRHKETLRIYTSEQVAGIALTNMARDVLGGGPKLKARDDENPKYSILAEQFKRSNEKTLAHDYHQGRT